MIVFEALDNGNVLVIVDDIIVRTFPPTAYIGIHKSKSDVIRIDSDATGGNSFVTFEFNASQVLSPESSNRNDLMRKLSEGYFKGVGAILLNVLDEIKQGNSTVETLNRQMKINNTILSQAFNIGLEMEDVDAKRVF